MTFGSSQAEKDCPFCAERIKAEAVKCRYCGSDLLAKSIALPRNLGKLLSAIAVLFLITIAVAGSPYWTLFCIQDALRQRKPRVLASFIDFPALRESLKAQILKTQIEDFKNSPEKKNVWSAMGALIGTSMLNATIDNYFTAGGVEALLSGEQLDLTNLQPLANSYKIEPEVSCMYESFDIFEVKVKNRSNEAAESVDFYMSRTSPLTWKVTSMHINVNSNFVSKIKTESSPEARSQTQAVEESPETTPEDLPKVVSAKALSNDFSQNENSLSSGPSRSELTKQIAAINADIRRCYRNKELEDAVPLFERSIELIKETGDFTALAEARTNYQSLLERIRHTQRPRGLSTAQNSSSPMQDIDPSELHRREILAYIAELRQKLSAIWQPPPYFKPNTVRVLFAINRAGAVDSVSISKSSGSADIDNLALKALDQAQPFKPLPARLPKKVDIEFCFDQDGTYSYAYDWSKECSLRSSIVKNQHSIPEHSEVRFLTEEEREGHISVVNGKQMGNIAPYRKDMLMRIAQLWHPKRKGERMAIQITIGQDGKLQNAEIIEPCGNPASEAEALNSIKNTEFEKLPSWYKGKQLTFKIDFEKVEALQ